VVVVESASAVATGDYLLTARAITPVVETEPNDSSATAQSINVGQVVNGSISALTDKDWYSFTLTAAGSYTIQTRNQANSASPSVDNLDTQLWICTAAAAPTCTYATGTLITNDDNGQRLYSLANLAFPAAGTYFIGVQPYSSFSGTLPGSYFLTIAPQ